MKFLVLLLSLAFSSVPVVKESPAPPAAPAPVAAQPFVSEEVYINGELVSAEVVDLSTGVVLSLTEASALSSVDSYQSDADTASSEFTKMVSDRDGGKVETKLKIVITKRPDESDEAWLKRFEIRCSAAISSGWTPVVK